MEDTTAVESEVTSLSEIADGFEKEMEAAPSVSEEVGVLEKKGSVDTLKKAAYYIVFAEKTQDRSEGVKEAITNVHIARFETRPGLKDAIARLENNNYQLIDIIKGRPLEFQIETKVVSDITIGA